jgi:hypothetical protein
VGAIKGDTGMARPEHSIRGNTVGCGSRMGVRHDASRCPHVVGSLRAGVWSLIVLVTLLEEQSVGAWLVGSSGSSSANGKNGLLLRVIH